jgi:hypothetical protein
MKKLLTLAFLVTAFTQNLSAQNFTTAIRETFRMDTNPIDMATDASGNTYITGSFVGSTVTIGGTTYNSENPLGGMFVVKYTPSGTVAWARIANLDNVFNGSYTECTSGKGIAVDASGNVYVAGSMAIAGIGPQNVLFKSPGNTISVPLTGVNLEGYLTKLNSNGVFQWVIRTNYYTDAYNYAGTYQQNSCNDLAIDGSGNVYVVGFHGIGSYISGNASSSVQGIVPTFFGGSFIENDYLTGYTLDPNGTIAYNYPNGTEGFVAKISPSGSMLWSETLSGTGIQMGNGSNQTLGPTVQGPNIQLDNADNIYISGDFTNELIINGVSIINSGGNTNSPPSRADGFVLKLNSNRVVQWLVRIGRTECTDGVGGMTLDNAGNVYIMGESKWADINNLAPATYSVPVAGGAVTFNNQFTSHSYLAKLNTNGVVQWVKAAENATNDSFNNNRKFGLVQDNAGSLYCTGRYYTGYNGGTGLPEFFLTYDGLTGSADVYGNTFLLKVNANNGNGTWVRTAVNTPSAGCYYCFNGAANLAFGGANTLTIGGTFAGIATFGSTTLTSSSDLNNLFVAKFTIPTSFDTAASGNWNANSTWLCNCLPDGTMPVRIMGTHNVTVPTGITGQAKGLRYMGAGKVSLQGTGKVELNN